jgi:hypothetical protein
LIDDVIQATADQRRAGDEQESVPDEVDVEAAPLGETGQQEIDRGQPDRVRDPVPVHVERADPERDRVGREVEHRARV